MHARWSFLFSVLLGAQSLGTANAEVIVPFGSCGWRYAFGIPGHVTALSVIGLDESQWQTGCTPVVATWGCSAPGIVWPSISRVVVRRHIFNAGGPVNVFYRIRARWAIESAWNGNAANGGNLGNECPPHELTGVYPLEPGDNIIAVDAYAIYSPPGDQNGGHLDIELSADGLTNVEPPSWGSLKLIYR